MVEKLNDIKSSSVKKPVIRHTGIDLQKLYSLKDWLLILQLLRIFNDITFPSTACFLIQGEQEPELKPFYDGFNWEMLRWRCSVAGEAIKELEKMMPKASNEVMVVINSKPELLQLWQEVSQYFDGNARADDKNRARAVRDKLFAHYDEKPIKAAFEKLLDIHKNQPELAPIGWHLQSEGDNGKISRNVLIDSVENLAWYQFHKIDFSHVGPDEVKLNTVSMSIQQLLSTVANFVNSLVIAYCEYYQLVTIEELPDWLKEEK